MPVSQINKTITPYSGDPPAIGQDQQTFSANAFRKAMHDPVVVEDINQVIGQINAVASEMNAAITEAVTKANEADQSANDAEASKLHARDYANEAAQIKADTQTLKEQANQARLDAEAALDAFDDKYLGSKTSDPTLDNDGEPLQEGAFYVNSTTGKIRVFTNGGWVQGIASVAGVESINAIQGAINLKSLNGVSLLGEGDIQTATLDGEETLTNKTIVDPILALSGTNGLAGQVPVSQGEGLPPVWGSVESLGSGGTTATGSVTLTAESPSMQSILTTSYGQSVSLPDATTLPLGVTIFGIYNKGTFPLLVQNHTGDLLGFLYPHNHCICSLSGNSDSSGEWDLSGITLHGIDVNETLTLGISDIGTSYELNVITIDTYRTLLMWSGQSALHAVVYDEFTKSFGPSTIIRTGDFRTNLSKGVLSSANQVLVVSCTYQTTSLQAVVLTINDKNISVGTAVGVNLSSPIDSLGSTEDGGHGIVKVGTSFLLGYTRSGPIAAIRALTISGTTVTFGTEVQTIGTGVVPLIYSVSSTVALVLSQSPNANVVAHPYTVSSISLSPGTYATLPSSVTGFRIRQIGSKWYALHNNANVIVASIINLVDNVASANSINTSIGTLRNYMHVVGDRVILIGDNGAYVTIRVLSENNNQAVLSNTLYLLTTSNAHQIIGFSESELWITWSTINSARRSYGRILIDNGNPVVRVTHVVGEQSPPQNTQGSLANISGTYKTEIAGVNLVGKKISTRITLSPLNFAIMGGYLVETSLRYDEGGSGSPIIGRIDNSSVWLMRNSSVDLADNQYQIYRYKAI